MTNFIKITLEKEEEKLQVDPTCIDICSVSLESPWTTGCTPLLIIYVSSRLFAT
jgi:hypothetical protein